MGQNFAHSSNCFFVNGAFLGNCCYLISYMTFKWAIFSIICSLCASLSRQTSIYILLFYNFLTLFKNCFYLYLLYGLISSFWSFSSTFSYYLRVYMILLAFFDYETIVTYFTNKSSLWYALGMILLIINTYFFASSLFSISFLRVYILL